jgi:hypothetical protein
MQLARAALFSVIPDLSREKRLYMTFIKWTLPRINSDTLPTSDTPPETKCVLKGSAL